MIKILEYIIRSHWNEWFNSHEPRRLTFCKIASNPLPNARVNFLVFNNQDKFPILVIKTPREIDSNICENETNILKRIRQQHGEKFNIPHLLFYDSVGDRKVQIETALQGKLMGNMRSPWHVGENEKVKQQTIQDLHDSLQWLAIFHTMTKSETRSWASLEAQLERNRILNIPKAGTDAHRIIAKIINWLDENAVLDNWPLICEHGDFWAGNIYRQKTGIGVIDWSDAAFNKFPLYDAPLFIVSYSLGFLPINNDPLYMFKNLFVQNHWFAEVSSNALRNYYKTLNINIDQQILIGLALALKASLKTTSQTYQQMLSHWENLGFLD